MLLPLASQANLMANLKKFKVGKDGLWESHVEVLKGPKGNAVDQKACLNMKDVEKNMAKIKDFSDTDKNCKTEVVEDSADSAKVIQNCKMGPVKTKSVMTWKKTSADSYTMLHEHYSNDALFSKVLTTTKFAGPCSEKDKPKPVDKAEMAKNCKECTTNLTKLKADCATKGGQEKQMCQSMISQFEGMCKMSCP